MFCTYLQNIYFIFYYLKVFFLGIQRLPEQIRVKHEKMKEEMIGMHFSLSNLITKDLEMNWVRHNSGRNRATN